MFAFFHLAQNDQDSWVVIETNAHVMPGTELCWQTPLVNVEKKHLLILLLELPESQSDGENK
jgi:hypothetical protein